MFAGVVYWTPDWAQADGTFPKSYYAIIVLIYCAHQVGIPTRSCQEEADPG